MNPEIKAIIEKNLPAEVGTTLKTVLEKAAQDAETVKLQVQRINTLEQGVLKQEETIKNYQKQDERNAKLGEREKIVSEKERNLEIETLKFQLAAEKEKTSFSKEVALGLVRNIEYRNHIYDTQTGSGYYNQQGMWVAPTEATKSFEEKKEAK